MNTFFGFTLLTSVLGAACASSNPSDSTNPDKDAAAEPIGTVVTSGGSGGARNGDAGEISDAGGAAGSSGEVGNQDGGLWLPKPGTTWQWQLTGTIDTTVDVQMYDIDLFDVSQSTIDKLRGNGRAVICYFSAGSSENWRPDFSQFQSSDQGNPLDGWPGERWLDVRSANVRTIMKARLDLAASKRCNGVEPDNVDGFANDTGLNLTRDDELDYLRFLLAEAHGRGLSIGLKNALDLVATLVGQFDWALNEECLKYAECASLRPFITSGKAVFHVEYGDSSLLGTVCGDSSIAGFSTLIKKLTLDAWRLSCP